MAENQTQLLPHERRRHPRYALSGRIPGRFYSESGDHLTVYPVDISAFGLGPVFNDRLPVGAKLICVLFPDTPQEITMDLEVRWIFSGSEFGDGFQGHRGGLWVVNDKYNLSELLESAPDLTWEELT